MVDVSRDCHNSASEEKMSRTSCGGAAPLQGPSVYRADFLYRREFIAALVSGAAGFLLVGESIGSHGSHCLKPAMFVHREPADPA
jgi:hypothetical protein